MRKLIISTLLFTGLTFPAFAQEPNFFPLSTSQGLGDPFHGQKPQPLRRTTDEPYGGNPNCVNTNYGEYCSIPNNQTGINEIEDSFLYNNCDKIGNQIDGGCYTYGGQDEDETPPVLIEIRDWQGGN